MRHTHPDRSPAPANAARALSLAPVLLALWTAPAAAQEPGPAPPPLPLAGGQNDPRQEMIELFRKVELKLREIDALLFDASAGRTDALDEVADSGMDALLKRSMTRSEEVLSGIDRILEIAEQAGGT